LWGCASLWLSACQPSAPKAPQLPYYNSPDFTPLFIEDPALVEAQVPHQIAHFAFRDQDSLLFTQAALAGKVHVANFMFTSCGSICPAMTANLKRVSDHFAARPEVAILSYTVTPWIDKVDVLKTYKDNYEIRNPNWHFLTGDKAAIYTLARQSYFAEEEFGYTKDSTEFLHTEHFLLVDKTQRIRGIYNGTLALEMQQLIEDIETLTAE
jgi:protein SCO1/2